MGLFLTLTDLKTQQIWPQNLQRQEFVKDAENEQHDIKILLNKLRNYNPTKPKKIEAEKEP